MKKIIFNFIIIAITVFPFVNSYAGERPDIIVAKDGSGNFTKVQEAFNAVADNKSTRTIIFVKAGTYKERLILSATKKNVTLIGESLENTILTYDDYQNKVGKDNHSTLIEADNFIAENITFENTIDSRLPQYSTGGQATALAIMGDKVILYKCKITGFQDTYYLKANKRSYTKDCIIDGTVDFIFGAGIALFENCTIRTRHNSHITAQNQKPNTNKYGFVFKDCQIIVYPGESVSEATLGRPWGAGSRVVFINCYEGAQITSVGWAVWSTDPSHKYYKNWETSYYGEYKCYGPGFKPASRLSWTHQLTDEEAVLYTKEHMFAAGVTTAVTLSDNWNPVINSTSLNKF